MSNKCNHEKIAIFDYRETVKKEICSTETIVNCCDCQKILYNTQGKGHRNIENYLELNKDKFKVLFDGTCNELNNKFNIKSENDQLNMINLLKYCKELIEKEESSQKQLLYKDMCKDFIATLSEYGEHEYDLVLIPRSEEK